MSHPATSDCAKCTNPSNPDRFSSTDSGRVGDDEGVATQLEELCKEHHELKRRSHYNEWPSLTERFETLAIELTDKLELRRWGDRKPTVGNNFLAYEVGSTVPALFLMTNGDPESVTEDLAITGLTGGSFCPSIISTFMWSDDVLWAPAPSEPCWPEIESEIG